MNSLLANIILLASYGKLHLNSFSSYVIAIILLFIIAFVSIHIINNFSKKNIIPNTENPELTDLLLDCGFFFLRLLLVSICAILLSKLL